MKYNSTNRKILKLKSVPAGLLLVFFFLLIKPNTYGQLVINEVSSANFSGITDEDVDFEDWIELNNNSADTIRLKNYTITDNPDLPEKWKFPDVAISPFGYMVVFASGKDRDRVVRKFGTVIYATDTFRYINPTAEPNPQWRNMGFTDTAWLTGQGGFGHGEGIYNTTISDTLMSVFLRKSFEIEDVYSIINAQLHVDYDDSFVAFLNGNEIARANIRPDGAIPEYNQAAWRQHTSQLINGGLPELFTVNHAELMRMLQEGENVLALQLHNNWLDDEMSINCWLSFGMENSDLQFSGTPDWFYHDTLSLHTDFKLDCAGEPVLIFDPDGNPVDMVEVPALPADLSYGRCCDGSDSCCYFSQSTPGCTNNQQEKFTAIIAGVPEFAKPAGFYDLVLDDSLSVALLAPDTGFVIRFTTDGSVPGDSSSVYHDSIKFNETAVVKARLFRPGMVPGKIVTNTYIINKTTNLPVVSVSASPHDLWDYEEGIYVLGPGADEGFPFYGANFWQDVEIPVHWEFFGPDQQRHFHQDAGLKIHGNWSRAFAQRSLRLTARSAFGSSELVYPFFEDKNIQNFKKLILRNAGNDFQAANLRDALIHKLVQPAVNIPVQDYLPVAVFLNADYWGILNLREKIDADYLVENFALDDDDIDLLENNFNIIRGDNQKFIELFHFIEIHDLSDPQNFKTVEDRLDITNVIDYFAVELFIVNTDWPQNNVKYWKPANGKWQYIFLDADNSMSFISELQNYTIDSYERILENPWTCHAIIFSKLLENENFRYRFISRYADLMNTIFRPTHTMLFIEMLKDSLIGEMAHHKVKWGGSVNAWESYHINNKLKKFFQFRPEYARTHTKELFSLDSVFRLYLYTENGMGSHIRVNSIIPENYPWYGHYFDSVPVALKALPAPGMAFSHWEGNGEMISGERQIYWHLTSHDTLTAHFAGLPDTIKPVITEINYASHEDMDAGDWIEFYNPNEEPFYLSGFSLKNDNDFKYIVFDTGTIIQPGGFLAAVQDTSKFNSIYPDVTNVAGSFDFGLRTYSSVIRLFDKNENLIVSLKYFSDDPWPTNIAGTGRTIKLSDPGLNMNDPLNWQPGCLGGSPGEGVSDCHEDPKMIFTEFNCKSSPFVDAGDWVEIYNRDTVNIDLGFWKFRDDNGAHIFMLPYGLSLAPGEFLVICEDTTTFRSHYPDSIPAIGNFDFGLSSGGDHLRLCDPWDNLISEVDYTTDAPWPQDIFGTGRTAEINDINGNINAGYNWRSGCLGGSPGGFPDPCHDSAAIIVTEINYRSSEIQDTDDWFEIYNNDSVPVSLNGWTFRDSDTTHLFSFPDDLIINPGDYLVVVEDSSEFISIHDSMTNFVGEFGFGLSADADEIRLFDKFAQEITHISYTSEAPWPENDFAPGRTIELVNNDAGQNDPGNWMLGCFGGSPGEPYISCGDTARLIVTEFKFDSGEGEDSGDWFEIFNPGNEAVSLYGWSFCDSDPGHEYIFPDTLYIQPDIYLVVVQDSIDFLSVHDTIPNFVGEFDFGLSSDADEIVLMDPYRREIVSIAYQTSEPWPVNPFAPGRSYELKDYSGASGDPANWKLGCYLGSPGEAWFECDDISVPEFNNPGLAVEAHPNPFDDEIRIDLKLNRLISFQILLMDVHGQVAKNTIYRPAWTGDHSVTLNTSTLKSGVYILQVAGAHYFITRMIVKY